MQSLRIEAKDDTPKVILDKEKKEFEISGKSLPEDVLEFYQPLYDWLELYVKDPIPETIFEMKIEYFNSATHKCINDILDILNGINDSDNKLKINWHFLKDDDDMLEAGHDYADLTGLDFEYIAD